MFFNILFFGLCVSFWKTLGYATYLWF